MGYHPETMVCKFPPYPSRRTKLGEKERLTLAGALYALEPWIGFDIWHIDPEKRSEGQRTDDSCGWFDRRPGGYAEAVQYLLTDETTMEEIARSIATRADMTHMGKYTYPRMSKAETLALCLMVARELETRRWWNGTKGAYQIWWRRTFTDVRKVDDHAIHLALNPLDNLSSQEDPEGFIRTMAACLNRQFRPWWRHPRWHVHHWKINFSLLRNLKRMVQPCATCGKGLGFGYFPTESGGGLHHHECLGIRFGGPAKSGSGTR